MQKNILINTITRWDEPPRARHQVARALAMNHTVVFIAASSLGIFPSLRSIPEGNLTVITPRFPVPYRVRYRIPLLNRLYQRWLFGRLAREYGDHWMINFDFTAELLHRYFSRIIYYCNDDHIGLSRLRNPAWIARYHQRCEQIMAAQAMCCIGTSGFLTGRLRSMNERAYEIRLGAPTVDESWIPVDPDGKKGDRIRTGIVGYLDTIDRELLRFLLDKDDLEITLIGPTGGKSSERILNEGDIRATGLLTGEALYKEVGSLDVGLIPYRLPSRIDRTPNKLWLYLAVGIPVVISDIEGIRDWTFPEGFLYRSADNGAFYSLIKRAHAENSRELARKRMAFARQNSWEKRVERLLELMDQMEGSDVQDIQ